VAEDKDQKLLQEKGGRGFPYIVFMDAEGNIVAKHQGQRTVSAFVETGKKAKAFQDLKTKADKGDKAAKFDYLVAQIEMGHLDLAAANKRIEEIAKDITADQKKKLDGLVVNLEVSDIGSKVKDETGKTEAAKKFLAMKKAGRVPTGEMEVQMFWIWIMDQAAADRDAATFEEGLNALKARFADNPNAKKFFEQREAQLQKLKEGK
jgi:hypothetical protein